MKSYSVYFANYTIGEDAYENVPQVCGHYGKRILLIGGEKAMEAGLGILEKAIQGTELEIVDKVVFGARLGISPAQGAIGRVGTGFYRRGHTGSP